MARDGILGGTARGKPTAPRRSTPEKAEVKRREAWLVLVGIALHAVYMLSIFDIYFKSPIVHGTRPVPQRIHPPAERLVLLIADGLRADKFFEPDQEGRFRNPFLRKMMTEKGRWGVSHARPPTESRPGHVAIIAGFYEDPSAVTKGWKANPVEFDSVFNKSRHTFAFGSPDIVPIFCSSLPHSIWKSYPHEFEDFAADASFLDQWSYDELHNLLNQSHNDTALSQLLHQDKTVIFLHLLGCDTNGHAHRPFSSIYLNNVRVVDHIAESVYNLVENYFNDSKTAYIFTADHGMSDKGSHGDGHPTNTDTPLVAWGAGIQSPKWVIHSSQPDDDFHFVDEHSHHLPTPSDWNLDGLERVDVNQADIAPLMATLVGLPCPVNSVGRLPLGFLDLSKAEEVEADLANSMQILNQFLRKSHLKHDSSLYFKPFKQLESFSLLLHQIEDLISTKEYDTALEMSQNLRNLSLAGLHYFQTYDWFMLMTAIILGYVGWMINLAIHIVLSYTSLQILEKNELQVLKANKGRVYLGGCLLMVMISFLLSFEKSPLLYHAYFAMTLFLWTRVFSNYLVLKRLWMLLLRRKTNSVFNLVVASFMTVTIVEFLVLSFTQRLLYTWCFLIAGVIGALFLLTHIPQKPSRAIYVWIVCWILSTFTLMPAEIPDNTELVFLSGAFAILIGAASQWFESSCLDGKNSSFGVLCEKRTYRLPGLFLFQAFLVGLSSVMVWLTTSHRTQKRELHTIHQMVNWWISGISLILPLFSPTSLLSRLTSIFLGFATPFLLLSIGYEAVFYGALALVLMGWIMVECSILDVIVRNSRTHIGDVPDPSTVNQDIRNLQFSDIRVPLIFMVLFNVAFFGTGNFASIASFEISSVYRFITVFSPFLMTGLLIFKLFIPYMLVICVFSAITKLLQLPRIGCYFLVILFSDMMTVHFFFLVRNTGSWMEIGNSISHFGIMSAQVVFVLFLFALTNIYTKDITINFLRSSSRKMI